MPNLSIVIPAAAPGKRMVSYGPRSLLELADGRSVLRRQVDLCKAVFPGADLVVVVGYEAERIVKKLPTGVRLVENEGFAASGSARSALLGVRATVSNRVLVFHGDLVFDRGFLESVPAEGSAVLVGETSNRNQVGVNVDGDDGEAISLTFGSMGPSWLQAVVLGGHELTVFRRLAAKPEARAKLLHEVLHEVIMGGGSFRAVPYGGRVDEIDTPEDYRTARRTK